MSDQTAILGPVTLRHVGYLLAGIGEVVVFVAVFRSPTRRTLAIGLAAAVLVAFMFLTTMHERYAYGALVFLALLIPRTAVPRNVGRLRHRVHAGILSLPCLRRRRSEICCRSRGRWGSPGRWRCWR